MNNILFAIVPFLLFGFVLEILLKGRFSRRLNFIVYNAVFAAVAIIHLAIGFTTLDNALLLSWMPVSAYLPMVITVFILSARNVVNNLFILFIGFIAAMIAELMEKLYVAPVLNAVEGVGGYIVCVVLLLAICAALAFVVFRYLRKIFSRERVLDTKNWYIDVALFFLMGLSVYLSDTTRNTAAIVLMLLCNVSVFAVIVGYLHFKYKSESLQSEREQIERQIEAEREEYRRLEQNIELGRRYRHDMRHHFSVIKELVHGGNAGEAEKYIDSLGGKLAETEQKIYCANPSVNAVLLRQLDKAAQCGAEVQVAVNIPKDLPFDSVDICAVLSNLVENAVNACRLVTEGERKLRIAADCAARNKITVSVENSVQGQVILGSDGLPIPDRSENHGYGLASVRCIVEKYNGLLHCEARKDRFSVKAVLFSENGEREPHRKNKRNIVLRSAAIIPAVLAALILSLNFMPVTLTALEDVPMLGRAFEIVDFRHWGFGWGDSGMQAEYPETDDDDANALIESYLDECREKFWWYFERKYNGYVGADFASEVIENDARMLTVSMHCTVNAGSSLTFQRFFTVDKEAGKIVELADLFEDGADYIGILSAEIKQQIEERVEKGDFYYGYGIFTSPEDKEMAFDTLNNPNFYIDGDYRLVIVFDEGEIAPNSMGMPTFVIPQTVAAEIADEEGLLAGGATR